MDAQKIIEVLRATLDANQQQAAHEQLQQVRKVAESANYKFSIQTHGSLKILRLKFCTFPLFVAQCMPALGGAAGPFRLPPSDLEFPSAFIVLAPHVRAMKFFSTFGCRSWKFAKMSVGDSRSGQSISAEIAELFMHTRIIPSKSVRLHVSPTHSNLNDRFRFTKSSASCRACCKS
jgi:hypothetical protein